MVADKIEELPLHHHLKIKESPNLTLHAQLLAEIAFILSRGMCAPKGFPKRTSEI